MGDTRENAGSLIHKRASKRRGRSYLLCEAKVGKRERKEGRKEGRKEKQRPASLLKQRRDKTNASHLHTEAYFALLRCSLPLFFCLVERRPRESRKSEEKEKERGCLNCAPWTAVRN